MKNDGIIFNSAYGRGCSLGSGVATECIIRPVHPDKRVAVIVSAREYDKLSGASPSLWQSLRTAPTKGVRLRIERDRSPGRLVKL